MPFCPARFSVRSSRLNFQNSPMSIVTDSCHHLLDHCSGTRLPTTYVGVADHSSTVIECFRIPRTKKSSVASKSLADAAELSRKACLPLCISRGNEAPYQEYRRTAPRKSRNDLLESGHLFSPSLSRVISCSSRRSGSSRLLA